jgi:hypothetical protein
MRLRLALTLAVSLVLSGCDGSSGPPGDEAEATPQAAVMRLTSSAFEGDGTMPAEFTCKGADRSPPLAWSDVPEGTRSLALVLEDPDAPSGTFHHWGAYNLAPDRRELAAGEGAPDAEFPQTKNDFGTPGYGGPCPPPGDPPHHYHFRLLALDTRELPGTPADAKAILDGAEGHVLASAELVARYGR